MSSSNTSLSGASGSAQNPVRCDVPDIFAKVVSERLPDILNHQKANGSIEYNPHAPSVYPQQAMMPLSFCWAGLDNIGRWKGDAKVETAIRRLGDYLTGWFDDRGQVGFNSHGYEVKGVDQRLTFAWLEGLKMLRDGGGDFEFEKWGNKILRACQYLIEHRLKKLVGNRRFFVRVTGTGTNHVALYMSLIYRAGIVLGRKDLVDFVLPLARAMVADVNPDGYWEEHSDVMRGGGPTPSYNYLSMGGFGLLADWTGEKVFRDAMEKAASFHANFCYPDGMFCDLLDERVRCDLAPREWTGMYDAPRIWGLYALSGTPAGRGSAALHMAGWLASTPTERPVSPETLARHVENYQYWQRGPIAAPPTDRTEYRALLTLPGGLFRHGPWCLGLSAMRSLSTEDDAYRDNPFTLDRQKLFSVFHDQVGLIIDGSHSKGQPDNSTFAAAKDQARDYFPSVAGEIGESGGGEYFARAIYKTFFGTVRLKPVNERTLRINLSVDPAATRGPFAAAFTLRMLAKEITGLNGKTVPLAENVFSLTSEELGGGFVFGAVTIRGPVSNKGAAGFVLNWPMSPFNSYSSDHKSSPEASVPRVSIELTPASPSAEFELLINASV